MTNNKKFYQRFCKDYNLPINVFEDGMFHYYRELYKEFFPEKEYKAAVELIETKFNGNVDLWLDYCAQVRDTAINTILESESYQKFNTMDLSEYKEQDKVA